MGFEYVAVEDLTGGKAHQQHVVVLKVGDGVRDALLGGYQGDVSKHGESADLMNPQARNKLACPDECVEGQGSAILGLRDGERNGRDRA